MSENTTNTERTEQNRSYTEAFADGVPGKVIPVYFGLAIVITWLGFLTVFLASEHGGDPEEIKSMVRMTKYMTYLFMALPFVYGAAGAVDEYRKRRSKASE